MTHLRTPLIGKVELIKQVKVVTTAPVTPEYLTEYFEGNQTFIDVGDLAGNTNKTLIIEANILNPGTGDTIIMRFNGISLGVYDYRYSYAGSTSTAAGNAQTSIALAPSTGNSSINNINIRLDATIGKNRNFVGSVSQIGSSQQTVAGVLLASGNWRDNTTELVSIRFGYASITDSIGVGTTIKVFSISNV